MLKILVNLALHSHASLLQDPFCENSALLVIIYHSSEQVQYGFFKNNNAIRETKMGCSLLFPFASRESEIFIAVLPPRKDSFVFICADKFMFLQIMYAHTACSIGKQALLILI